jgi:hypothetical protein
MAISHINGIAVSTISHFNGITKANISAINGVTAGFGGANLLTNLVSYWKLDEASGNATDSHGSNTLTDNNTVTTTTGKINGARSFAAASNEYLSRTDNADLSVSGNTDFAISCWVNITDKSVLRNFLAKWDNTGNQRAYRLEYNSGNDRFQMTVSGDGSASTTVVADNFGSPSTSTWYHVIAWHDATADTINICVNNGTPDSAAHSTGVFDNNIAFTMGARNGPFGLWQGAIDEVGFWKGRILDATARTALYNSGSGLSYDSF